MEENLAQEDLERTARYLNTEFSGKSLIDHTAEILELMREEKALYDRLLRTPFCFAIRAWMVKAAPAGLVDGASDILMKPDCCGGRQNARAVSHFREKSRLLKFSTSVSLENNLHFEGMSRGHWQGTSSSSMRIALSLLPLSNWLQRDPARSESSDL